MISTYTLKVAKSTIHNATLTEAQKREQFIQFTRETTGVKLTLEDIDYLSFGGDGKHSKIANKIRNLRKKK